MQAIAGLRGSMCKQSIPLVGIADLRSLVMRDNNTHFFCSVVTGPGRRGWAPPAAGGGKQSAALSLEPVKGGTMITYGDRTFCMRQGCTKKSCKSNLSNVDWSFGLPVSVADFWGKSDKCPKKEPAMMAFQEAEKSDTDT